MMKKVLGSGEPFCESCGERTLTVCPQCNAPIRGRYFEQGVISGLDEYSPPAFCHSCGNQFPWTERAILAAIELAADSGALTQDEEKQFADSVQEIAKDTSKAQLAGSRISRLLKKTGDVTAKAVRDILVEIVSETAKKAIWPDKK
jgi:hypothetical protein